MKPLSNERTIIFLISAIQFINILDFMIVMPLGPDFARALDIPASHLGYIAASYTIAASLAGLAGSFFLERFDRRRALLVALGGLIIATAAAGFAFDMSTLMLSRLAAGAFGGPASSLALAVIADAIPVARRGRAMGVVMGAFSVASVFGVPLGLELARHFGWRSPFFTVAALGIIIFLGVLAVFPSMTAHRRARGAGEAGLGTLLANPDVIASYLMTFVTMTAGFLIIPNISAYLQHNLGYPRAHIGLLYMVGGTFSFFFIRIAGALVDRLGSTRVGAGGSLLLCVVIFMGFVMTVPPLPVMVIFIGFMTAMSFRNVAYNVLTSKVPGPHERARFTSIQSTVQHLGTSSGAFMASQILGETGSHALTNMPLVGYIAIALSLLLPFLMHRVEGHVSQRAAAAATALPPA
ncbi:MAG: MFS transporter [Candidatus Hydrogenedentota bacterium]